MFLALTTLLVAMTSVQFGASMAKGLFPLLGPSGATAWRLTLAALMLGLVWRPWNMRPARNQWPVILRYGIALGLMNLTFYWAINRIPLGVAVALEFTGPLGVALWASRQRQDLLWAGLAGSGLLLLVPWGPMAQLDALGVGFALLAGMSWGAYIVYGQKLGNSFHGGRGVALGMLVAGLVTLPVGVIDRGAELWQPSLVVQAILVALFSSAIPYSLEMIALKRLPPATFGILMSLEPALATLMGWLFLQERLRSMELCAVVLIMVASLGSTLASIHASHKPPPPL